MRRLYLLLSFSFLLMPFLLFSCAKAPNFWEDAKPGQKKVLVSFPPLYSIAHAVAGEDAYVLSLLTMEGPHDYEGTPTDLFKVNGADLYIHNGLTLDDDFTDKMLRNHKNANLTTLNVGAVLKGKDKPLPKDKKRLIRGKPIQHGDHFHGAEDPHYWLSPTVAMAMTEIIAAKLAEIDPAHAKGYEKRAADYVKKLAEIEAYGKAAFKDKKNKRIITMHEAFGYFAKAFDLEIAATIQKQPGADPDAASMATLVTLCKTDKIALIAIERQYSRAPAEALRNNLKRDGIDIQIVEIDPLETAPRVNGKFNPEPGYYLEKMRENIDTLAKALP